MEKKCNGCKIIKDVKEFSKNRSTKDGLQYNCKGCVSIYNKIYKKENRNKVREYNKVYSKVYYEENKNYFKKYREKNKEIKNEYNKEYQKNRISNDPLYKLKTNIRNLIRNSLKDGGYTKDNKTNNIVGCSYDELLKQLNDNDFGFTYGDVNLDIDHIKPLSSATTKEEIIKLNHYTNLQLLPKSYNRYIKRDNDFDKEDFERWLEKK